MIYVKHGTSIDLYQIVASTQKELFRNKSKAHLPLKFETEIQLNFHSGKYTISIFYCITNSRPIIFNLHIQ